MGGSGKIDRNWAFVLSLCKRPDQDVSELVYDLLKDELKCLQDTFQAPWEIILQSLTSWPCLFKPNGVHMGNLSCHGDVVIHDDAVVIQFSFETHRGWYLRESPIGTALKLMCVFLPHVVASLLDKLLDYSRLGNPSNVRDFWTEGMWRLRGWV